MLSKYMRFLLFLTIIQVHTQYASLNELCDVIKNNPATCAKMTLKVGALVPLSLYAVISTVQAGLVTYEFLGYCYLRSDYYRRHACSCECCQKQRGPRKLNEMERGSGFLALALAACAVGCYTLAKKCVRSIVHDMQVMH